MRPGRAEQDRLSRIGLPVAAFVLPLVLYLLTCCRDIFWLDTTELMLCGIYLRLPHPPGYPLLILLLRLVSLVPVLGTQFRMNMVAALGAAGSCLFVYFSVRSLTGRGGAALFAALTWGLSFELWQQATALEVYSFQALIISAVLFCLADWSRTGEYRCLLLACFGFGLGMANHLTTVLLVPGFAVLAFGGPVREVRAGWLLLGLALFILPVSLYAILPVLSPPTRFAGWGGAHDLSGLIEFVSGRAYRYRLLAGGAAYIGSQAPGLGSLFGRQFLASWVLVVPGAWWCWKKNPRLGVTAVLVIALVTGFALAYNIPDKEAYLVPAHLAAVVVIGAGFAWLYGRNRIVAAGTGVFLLALPLLVFFPRQNRSRLHGLAELGQSTLAELPADAVLFTDDFSAFQAMRWVQSQRGARTDVKVVSEYLLVFPWYLESLGPDVPGQALALARAAWQDRQARGAGFGEMMKARIKDIKLELARNWLDTRRLFWLPQDFQSWPDSWRGLVLRFNGLCYEFCTGPDSGPLPTLNALPRPDNYRVGRTRDPLTEDLCLRLAAAANRRGILRFSRDDAPGALQDFELALEYFPDYPSAVENKGIVFFYSHEPDSARRLLLRFLELDPESPEAPKVRLLLRQIQAGQSP